MPRIFLLQQELFLQQETLEEGRAAGKFAPLNLEKDIFIPSEPVKSAPKPLISVEVVKNHFDIRDITTSEDIAEEEKDDKPQHTEVELRLEDDTPIEDELCPSTPPPVLCQSSSLHPDHQEDKEDQRRKEYRTRVLSIVWTSYPSRTSRDERRWLSEVSRRKMHRKEARSVSGRSTGGSGGFSSGGSGGFSSSGGGVQAPSGGGFIGGGPSKGGNRNNNNEDDIDEIDQFGCPDSPTQQWLADNADLSPLQVLDNISLKSEFPSYTTVSMETDKPPDISNIGMDPGTTNLLQFAASVPVPDHATASFLDIGLESFQSLYEDLGELITTTDPTLDLAMVKGNLVTRTVSMEAGARELSALDLKSLGIQIQVPGIGETTITAMSGPPLKSLIEPLPASALKGLVKVCSCSC